MAVKLPEKPMVLTRLVLFLYCLVGFIPILQACQNSPTVTEVYPRADKLPENLLRLYVYFDQPMHRNDALKAIRLLDENENVVDGTFLANKVDLWSPDGHRLTLLLDPGRVKTGLRAHNTMGRAIKSGNRYTLQIDSSISNEQGCNLTAEFNKIFNVIDADYSAVDLSQWNVITPQLNSMDWLDIQLNKPHDHVSLAYSIRVIDENNSIIPGHIDLGAADSQWLFQPIKPWQDQNYRIVINPMFEDVAGNRLSGSFEQPLADINVSNNEIEFKSVATPDPL